MSNLTNNSTTSSLTPEEELACQIAEIEDLREQNRKLKEKDSMLNDVLNALRAERDTMLAHQQAANGSSVDSSVEEQPPAKMAREDAERRPPTPLDDSEDEDDKSRPPSTQPRPPGWPYY